MQLHPYYLISSIVDPTALRRNFRCFLLLLACAISLPSLAQKFDRQKYLETLNEFRPIAEQGDIDAQFLVGVVYLESPLDGDAQIAAYWLEKAAEKGHLKAQLVLGNMYRSNPKIQDYTKAIRWLEIAATRGDPVAQYGIGTMLYHGYGIKENHAAAMSWFLKAAEQNEVRAQGILGNMYLQGQGVPQNYLLSANWFRRAGAQGDTTAMSALGLIYENGWGLPKSLIFAYVAYSLANTGGEKSARDDMFRVGEKLSPEAINEAQRLAAMWKLGTPLPSPPSVPAAKNRINGAARFIGGSL